MGNMSRMNFFDFNFLFSNVQPPEKPDTPPPLLLSESNITAVVPNSDYKDIEYMIASYEEERVDVDYILTYIREKNYTISQLPVASRKKLGEIMVSGFSHQCEASFYFSPSIRLHRQVYTNKYTGNDLFVLEDGSYVLMTDFLKIYDAIRETTLSKNCE